MDYDAPEFISEEDEQYLRQLFNSSSPVNEDLKEMDEREQAIELFLRAHQELEIFKAQADAIDYIWSGRRFH